MYRRRGDWFDAGPSGQGTAAEKRARARVYYYYCTYIV